MEAAAVESINQSKLVLAVGSFRAEEKRTRFRELAVASGVSAITVRVTCPVAMAAERVRSRIALGERGPGEEAIRQIDAELNRASGIDAVLINDASIAGLHRQVDLLVQVLDWASDRDAPGSAVRQRLAALAAGAVHPGDMVERTAQMKPS